MKNNGLVMEVFGKYLAEQIEARYPGLDKQRLVEKLIEIGVIDPFRVRALTVREYVDQKCAAGLKKIEAMEDAADFFGCSYEAVRKFVYYYTDINF